VKIATDGFVLHLFAIGLAGGLYGQSFSDITPAAPSPGTNDIFQLSTNGSQTWPDGLNYFTDNSAPAGQTFTTRSNAMNLVSVAVKTAGLNSGNGYGTPASTPTYYLRIYSMSGNTATLLNTFSAPNPGFNDGDWLQWSGLIVPLPANKTCAFSFGIKPSSGGWAALDVATNAYPGGESALVPISGGTISTGGSHSFDAVFALGLRATNLPVATAPVASTNVIYLGSTVTITSSIAGSAPLSYQWRTDGGSGRALTDLPGATNLSLTNTPALTGTFQYALVVTNGSGSFTSSVATVTVLALPGTANVTVNVSSNLAVVPATGYGLHTSVYTLTFDDPALPGKLSQGGVSMLRYPGGGYADGFHWSVSRPELGWPNGYGMTPWSGDTNAFGYMGPNTDFASFIKLVTNAQCQALITVNFGGGQKWDSSAHTKLTVPTTNAEPPEAAAWVAYANASTNNYGTANDVTLGTDSQGNDWKTAGYWAMMRAATPLGTDDGYNFLRIGRTAPIGIKYWEIGNETFGTGYYDAGGDNGYCLDYAVPYPYTTYPRYGNTNLSPAAYGRGVKSFSLLMKKVDPTVKIGAVITTPPGDYSWDYYNGQHWTPETLAQCATDIDFMIAHSYLWNGSLDDGSQTLPIPGSIYPAMVNGTSPHTGQYSGPWDYLTPYRSDGTNVQLFITEFGYTGSLTNSINGEPITGPVNTLFAADSYATWLELGVANIDFLEMSVDSFLGTVATPGGVYYAVQLTHAMAGSGDQLVSAASDVTAIRAHAAVQQSGKIGVLLLNENRTNSLTVNVSIPNVNLASSASQIQFGTNHFSGGSTVPIALPTTNTVSVSGNSLSVTIPPYTMSVLTIPILSNTPPVLAAISNRTVNVGQTVAFTAGATDTDTPLQTLTFTLLAGPANGTVNTNSGAFSFRPLVTQANSTNNFTLEASDNGTPSLSATQSFSVSVNPLSSPGINNISVAGGKFGFSVSGQGGPDYAIETSTNLTQWSSVFITNSPVLPFNWADAATNAAQRFYRIKLGPPLP
jgi:alpha-L-arabinofuranosidase